VHPTVRPRDTGDRVIRAEVIKFGHFV
jgi:hypothetical protein